jgi:MFS family permease
MRLFTGTLWRHQDFLKLWSGETVSKLGSEVTLLALPTVAILMLHAGPFQVGLLGALEFLCFPLLGLPAGVIADRLRRRPIMIVCDLGRAVALGSIPLAYSLKLLSINQLYLVALITGLFTVFFDVSYQSYLPSLIERRHLVEGNTKLQVSESAAQIGGPALAGFLIQLISAARAIAVDAFSYLVSALAIFAIRRREPVPRPADATGRTGFLTEMREGLGVVFGNPVLWHIAGCTGTFNLGSNMFFAVFLIFAYRQLHLSPGVVGVVFAASSVGFLLGALAASRFSDRLGVGGGLAVSIVAGGIAQLLTPLALIGQPALVLFGLMLFGSTLGAPYNIIQVSLRQAITPDRLQGRMNATMRTIVWGTIPIGAALGGVLGSSVGVVQTLIIGGAIETVAVLWILIGPVIRVREQPEPVSA